MKKISYRPTQLLLPYIDRYWHWSADSKNKTTLLPLFAGTGVDLYIHEESPFIVDAQTLSRAHIVCPRQLTAMHTSGNLSFWAIRFRCGAFRHFCNINFSELNNSFLSVEDIWKQSGMDLLHKLRHTTLPSDKTSLFDSFLLSKLTLHKKENTNLDRSISYLYNNFNSTTICSLADNMNMSLRNFERLFKNGFGVSPKRFQDISRFQAIVKDILLNPQKELMQLTFDNGYYDQSHFIKSFKSFASISPSEFIKLKEYNSHFYFKKLY